MPKRLRIIAGPNGSGKTSLYEQLTKVQNLNLGIFVNADIIEQKLKKSSLLSFSEYNINASEHEFKNSFNNYFKENKTIIGTTDFTLKDNFLVVNRRAKIDSYFAGFVADFIRNSMFSTGIKTFTTETVMSHPSKIDLIEKAKKLGYRIYLYYIATEDHNVNIGRVFSRQLKGGHSVPKNKIKSRYTRSLENLYYALILSDRAYLFDNSNKNIEIVAEYEAKSSIFTTFQIVPNWLRVYVINKFSTNS